MKRFALCATLACMLPLTHAHAADRYLFDKAYTKLFFSVNHLGFSNFYGEFKEFDGSFTFSQNHPETSHVDVNIAPKGIRTDSAALDDELKATAMFDAKHFPTVHFASDTVRVTGKNTGVVQGKLTIKNITKPVVLTVVFNKCGTHPMTKEAVCGFSADGAIQRTDFGLNAWNGFVGDTVKLHFEVEGVNEWRAKKKLAAKR